jgi:hypothetical protein
LQGILANFPDFSLVGLSSGISAATAFVAPPFEKYGKTKQGRPDQIMIGPAFESRLTSDPLKSEKSKSQLVSLILLLIGPASRRQDFGTLRLYLFGTQRLVTSHRELWANGTGTRAGIAADGQDARPEHRRTRQKSNHENLQRERFARQVPEPSPRESNAFSLR